MSISRIIALCIACVVVEFILSLVVALYLQRRFNYCPTRAGDAGAVVFKVVAAVTAAVFVAVVLWNL
jgi:hypothetical protein